MTEKTPPYGIRDRCNHYQPSTLSPIENRSKDNVECHPCLAGAVPPTGDRSAPLDATDIHDKSDPLATAADTFGPHHPPKGRVQRRHMALEYDLRRMYPEMSLLTETAKSKWNYQDPSVIRAIWIESKTNALAEWKTRFSKIKYLARPRIEVRPTVATEARKRFRRLQDEKRFKGDADDKWAKAAAATADGWTARNAPEFQSVEIVSNATTDMRLKFNKNNPPVPRYYIEHFHRYKKPPFRIALRRRMAEVK